MSCFSKSIQLLDAPVYAQDLVRYYLTHPVIISIGDHNFLGLFSF
jgi:hypothetical protein